MRSFLPAALIIAVLSYVLMQFLPWWIIAPVSFLACWFLFPGKGAVAFSAGFTAVFLLWTGYAFALSRANDHLLAAKVTELLRPLTGGSVAGLHIFTGIVGGLVGGLSAMTGAWAAKLKS